LAHRERYFGFVGPRLLSVEKLIGEAAPDATVQRSNMAGLAAEPS